MPLPPLNTLLKTRERILTLQQKEEMCRLYETGSYTFSQLSELFPVGKSSIGAFFRRRGYSSKITQDIKEGIISLYKENPDLRYKKVATDFGIWASTVKYILKEAGIVLRNSSESSRKYKINETFFDVIDTEEKAYFLGFLYADGYNNTSRNCVRLILQERDKYIVEKLNCLVQPTKPLYYTEGKISKRNNSPKWGTVIANKHVSKTLEDKGCGRAKTFTTTFPHWLDTKLIHHFIRGYFDGDGCIYYNKNTKNLRVEMIGTESFLLDVQDIMYNTLGINKTKPYKKPGKSDSYNIVSIIYGTNNSVIKLKDWLYQDATIYLQRKLDRFKL